MALIVALLGTAVLAPVAARVAVRYGVVDRPGPLKVQSSPVPYLGGAAVLAGLAAPVAFERAALLVPLVLAAAVGLIDDVAGLAPLARLVLEAGVGVSAAVVLSPADLWGAVVSVVAVVALVNAVNLLDGLDALASGVALTSAVGFAVLLVGDARVLALALAGALAGFLVWNRPPARIYLGDAGSYLIGTALAMLLAESLAGPYDASVASGSVLLVAVPVGDTAIAILRRLRSGRALFGGDRGHVYDQLVDRGLSTRASTMACVAAQALLVAVGVSLAQFGTAAAITATVAAAVVVAALTIPRFTAPGTWRS